MPPWQLARDLLQLADTASNIHTQQRPWGRPRQTLNILRHPVYLNLQPSAQQWPSRHNTKVEERKDLPLARLPVKVHSIHCEPKHKHMEDATDMPLPRMRPALQFAFNIVMCKRERAVLMHRRTEIDSDIRCARM